MTTIAAADKLGFLDGEELSDELRCLGVIH